MKLISCHVEGFGAFVARDFAFTDGVNTFNHPNGWGKTTLAAFLRIMFYGMKGARSNAKDFLDRTHYLPFSGGNFGGNIVFEYQGNEYRIERSFGAKSDRDDTVTMYKNGILLPAPPQDPGRQLFGLDEASFLRTVFLSADSTEGGITGDINAKLNHLIDAQKEENDAQNAIKILKEEEKKISTSRGSGIVPQKKAALKSLREDIANLESIADGLEGKYAQRAALQAECSRLEAEKQRADEQKLLAARREKYLMLVAERDRFGEKIRGLAERYPHGIPTREECDALIASASEIEGASARLAAAHFSDGDAEKLRLAEEKYPGGVPTEEDLRRAEQAVQRAAALRAAANAARLNAEEEAELTSLCADGRADSYPDADALARMREEAAEIGRLDAAAEVYAAQIEKEKSTRFCDLSARYPRLPARADTERGGTAIARYNEAGKEYHAAADALMAAGEAEKAARKAAEEENRRAAKKLLIPAAVSVLLVIAGLILLAVNKIVGAVLIAAGLASFCICVILLLLRRPKGQEEETSGVPDALTRRAENAKREMAQAEADVREILEKYGFPAEDAYLPAAWAQFADDAEDYADSLEKIAQIREALDGTAAKKEQLLDGLCAKISACGGGVLTPADGVEGVNFALGNLARDGQRLADLTERAENLARERQKLTGELDAARKEAAAPLAAVGIDLPQSGEGEFLAALRTDAELLLRLRAEAARCAAAERAEQKIISAETEKIARFTEKNCPGSPVFAPSALRALAAAYQNDRAALEENSNNFSAAAETAEKFRLECGFDEVLPAKETPDAESGTEAADGEAAEPPEDALNRLRAELARLERQIDDDEADAARLPIALDEEKELSEEIKALTARAELYRKTGEYILRADESLRNRYVAPVRDVFLRYAEKIEAAIGEKMVMDTEYRVLFERAGVLRSDNYLSAGQRDVCTLCLRLALLENIFGDEHPFIILDDPFVALDEKHLARTAEVMRALAGDCQILYFCAHGSRAI